jgi:hypothetical protein
MPRYARPPSNDMPPADAGVRNCPLRVSTREA